MTSEQPDTNAIRAWVHRGVSDGKRIPNRDLLALCDALDVARAQRDRVETENNEVSAYARGLEARAEAAEAELAHTKALVGHYMRHLYAAEGRIAKPDSIDGVTDD